MLDEQLLIAPLSRDHFATIASWFTSARDVAIWAGPSSTYPVDDAQFEAMLDETRADPPARMARVATLDGLIAAHAQLAVDWSLGNATLQRVAVAPTLRGRGLSGRFLRRLIQEAFSYPEIVRIDLRVFPFNHAAIRSYERLGFVYEGRLRSSMPFENERWDTLVMSVLRDPP